MPPPYRGVAEAAVSRVAAVAGEWQCDGSGSAGIDGEERSVDGHEAREFLEPVEDDDNVLRGLTHQRRPREVALLGQTRCGYLMPFALLYSLTKNLPKFVARGLPHTCSQSSNATSSRSRSPCTR